MAHTWLETYDVERHIKPSSYVTVLRSAYSLNAGKRHQLCMCMRPMFSMSAKIWTKQPHCQENVNPVPLHSFRSELRLLKLKLGAIQTKPKFSKVNSTQPPLICDR